MLFYTYEFIFGFLPIVLLGFYLFGWINQNCAAFWLATASLSFYGWWNPKFVSLLVASIAFNYFAGALVVHASTPRVGRVILTVAILVDLGVLAYFKYANFIVSSFGSLVGSMTSISTIVLPIGISFFTFTQIAFLVDAYRGIAREYRFVHYVLFVSYFPYLIAGPVLHHKQMMPQFSLSNTYRVSAENVAVGLSLFVLGLGKKILVADAFGQFADPVFAAAANGNEIQFFAAWSGALAYTFQLYFDFSGYSDMAIGLSRLFGIQLPINFYSPSVVSG